ncbi:MAG TPA: FecR domain-containing protein [Gemmatimonadaceae bacterium]|nr:FecR domain-containing protein [Gemmatimonadaceae bacterium]
MSTSVPPRDGSARPGSVTSFTPFLTDEQTLKSVFDAEFTSYLESARSKLGDAAAQAPRVVESAFCNAWKQRATLSNADQLRAFLAEEVQHGASRTVSRRAAAHRFGTHGGRDSGGTDVHSAAGGTSDAAGSWARIVQAMHDTNTGADSHAAAATAGRHEAASHMRVAARKTSWMPLVGIGVVALGLSVGGALYMSRLGEDDAVASAVSTAGLEPIAASSAGQMGSTTLADGTKLRIGPETKITLPEAFPTKIRAVRVDGTAQFEVAAGQVLPFRVVAKRMHFIATGTKFIISAYPGDSGVMVQVREGTVTVKAGKKSAVVAANQSLYVDNNGMKEPSADQIASAFGWVDGQVATSHRQLRYVVTQLTRWFNLDVKVPDLPLLDRDASFAVSLDSSKQAIAQVEKSANVKFSFEGDSRVFRDAGAKK